MKTFECFWGDGYRDASNKSTLAYHDQDFFNEERGYEPDWINSIDLLEVDQVFSLNCAMTGEHWVRRIA
jgi:hypothetical protein